MDFKGLTASQVEESRKKHGSNVLTEIPPDPLWKKMGGSEEPKEQKEKKGWFRRK